MNSRFLVKEQVDKTKIFYFPQKIFSEQIKISDFLDVIYTTSKNELKMMWLSRNTKLLDSFPLKNGKLSPLCVISLLSVWVHLQSARDKHEYCPHHTRQKNYGSLTIACLHNKAHMNCRTCTYFSSKQTE